MAGTDTTSCNADPACTKFKKTCAAEAGWGFWVDQEITVVFKDTQGNYSQYKDSTHAAYAQMRCYPASCEGMELPMLGALRTYELKEGTTGPTKTALDGTDGMTATVTTVVEKMPAPVWFYIVIVVAVLSIALTVCLIKKYGQTPTQAQAQRTEEKEEEAQRTGSVIQCCPRSRGRRGSAAATTPHPTQAQRKEEKDEKASTPKEYEDAPPDFEED